MAKSTPQAAHYRPRPNRGDKCADCTMFRPPHGCTAVSGTISPAGWCSYFKARKVQHFDDGGDVDASDSELSVTPITSNRWGNLPKSSNVEDRRGENNTITGRAANAVGEFLDGPLKAYSQWQTERQGQQPAQTFGGVNWNEAIDKAASTDTGGPSGIDATTASPAAPISSGDSGGGTSDSGGGGSDNSTPNIPSMARGGRVPEDWEMLPHFDDGGDVDDDENDEADIDPEMLQLLQQPAEEEEEPVEEQPAVEEPPEEEEEEEEEPVEEQPPQKEPYKPRRKRYALNDQEYYRPRDVITDSPTYDEGEPQRMADTNLRQAQLAEQAPATASPAGAFGRSVLRSAADTALNMPGISAGASIGGSLGALGGPLAPVTIPAGAIAGGLIGGLAESWSGLSNKLRTAREWVSDILGIDSPEQRAVDLAVLPKAGQVAAEIVGAGPTLFSARGASLTQRALMGGVMGGQNALGQYVQQGDVDWPEAIAHAASGAVWATPNRLGRPFWQAGEAPVEWTKSKIAPGRPNLDNPENTNPPPGEQPANKEATDGTSPPLKVSRGTAPVEPAPIEDRGQDVATLGVVADEGNTGRWAKGASKESQDLSDRLSDVQAALEEALKNERAAPEEQPSVQGGNEAETRETPQTPQETAQTSSQRPEESPTEPTAVAGGGARIGSVRPRQGTEAPPPPTGHPEIDAAMNSPVVRQFLKDPMRYVNDQHDVKYLAGATANPRDPTFYVDKDAPKTLAVKRDDSDDRVTIPTAPLWGLHENVEQQLTLDKMDQIRQKYGREPTDQEKAAIYKWAHPLANIAERSLVKAAGLDIADYDAQNKAAERAAEQKPIRDAPADIFLEPYRGRDLQQMEAAGARQDLQPGNTAAGARQDLQPGSTARNLQQMEYAAERQPAAGAPAAERQPAEPAAAREPAEPAAARVKAISKSRSAPPKEGMFGGPPEPPLPHLEQGKPKPPFGGGALPKEYRGVGREGMPWVATDIPGVGTKGRGPARSLADRFKEKDNEYVQMANNVRRAFWDRADKNPQGLKNISEAWDKNDLNALPKKDRDEWDRTYAPLVEATNTLRNNMKEWYRREKGFSDDQIAARLGDDTENGMMRVRQDFKNMPEWQALQNLDTIMGGYQDRPPQYVTRIKPREFVALERDDTGNPPPPNTSNRRIISIHRDGNGFSEWQNKKIVREVRDSNFDHRIGATWPEGDQVYRVRDALMPEIEQHGLDHNNKEIKYLRDPRVSAWMNFMLHFRAAQDMQMLEGIPNDPLLSRYMVKSDDRIPAGWVKVNSEPFRDYYAAPALARTLDMYNRPGIHDNTFMGIRKLSRMLINTMFWQALKHPFNVIPHYFEHAGFSLITPQGNLRRGFALPYAISELIQPGRITERFLDHPATLMYQNTMADRVQRAIQGIGDAAIRGNAPTIKRVALELGVKPTDLVKGWYQVSRETTWALGDFFYNQALIETAMKEAKWFPWHGDFDIDKLSDDQIEKVINKVNKSLPTYRIPESQLGMAWLSALQSDQALFAFGPYHHALLNGYTGILKDALGPKSNIHNRGEAIGRLFGLFIAGGVVWPQLDKITQFVTGNPDATFIRSGPLAPYNAIKEFMEGQSEAGFGALQHIFKPSPLARSIVDLFMNEDWKGSHIWSPYHLRNILNGGALPFAGQVLSHFARNLVAPISSAQQYAQSHLGPLRALRDDFFGIKEKNPKRNYFAQKQATEDIREGLKREYQTKDYIEQFFNWLHHLGQ